VVFSGNSTLIWVLVAFAVISLALSTTAFIVQLRRNRKAKKKTEGNSTKDSSSAKTLEDINLVKASWKLPEKQRSKRESNDYTEVLFPSQLPNVDSGDTKWEIALRESGPDYEAEHRFKVDKLLPIGRTLSEGFIVKHKTVSGLQCILSATADGVLVENKSESNITRLNGSLLDDPKYIKQGDVLNIGKVQLYIHAIRQG